MDEEKMEKTGERAGKKRKGDSVTGSPHQTRVRGSETRVSAQTRLRGTFKVKATAPNDASLIPRSYCHAR